MEQQHIMELGELLNKHDQNIINLPMKNDDPHLGMVATAGSELQFADCEQALPLADAEVQNPDGEVKSEADGSTDSDDAASVDQIRILKENGKKAFKKFDGCVRRELGRFIEVGFALGEIKREKLWMHGGFDGWEDYCIRGLTYSPKNCNYLIAGSKIAKELEDVQIPGFSNQSSSPTSESQVRHLNRLETVAQRRQAWIDACKMEGRIPSERKVKKLVDAILHVDIIANGKKEAKEKKVRDLLDDLREGIELIESLSLRTNLEAARSELYKILIKSH